MADSAYWQTLERLFHGALEMPARQRRGWLEEHCPPDLVREVLELLDRHGSEYCRLDHAISETAREAGEFERTGRRLGPYRVLERIGEGGMGAVYLAERDDEEYRRKVAIKVIRGFPGDRALERLRQERQILADLDHPNIARLLDGGSTEDGQPYLVLEYIDGVPIVDWCRRNNLEREQRIRLMLDICDAVHYAHQHLVIHRDIKPGNVLVSQGAAPAGGRPVLLDFGIAKLKTSDAVETTRTARFYTPGYASPEQLAGKRITTASDIYSLGRLLLALLDVDVTDAATGDDNEPVFRRAAWKRRLPRELAAIVDQATRDEPERRYPTASALRADLVNFLEGRPVGAVPDRFGYRLGKFVRRNRVAVVTASIAVLIGAGLLWRLVAEYDRARTAEATARTEALRAEQTSAFLLNMLGSIEPEYADGADTALMQRVLEDAAARAPVELETQPLILSDIQYAIGRAYLGIGVHDPAGEHLTAAAELARGTPAGPRYLKPMIQLALRDLLLGNFQAGIERVDTIIEIANAQLERDDPHRLDAMHIKANLLLNIDDNDAAAEILGKIIERTAGATGSYPVNIRFESLRSLAHIHSNTGRLEESIEIYEQVRGEASGWDDPSAKRHIAATLNDQGVALLKQQKYAEAEPLLRESLALQEQRYGAEHPRLVHVLSNLGGSLRQQGRPDAAKPIFERALALAADAYGPEQPPTLAIKYNLGNLLRVQGDAAAAVELQRAVLAGAESAFPPGHSAHSMFRLGLGQSELALGNAARAAELLQEAADGLTEHHGPDYHRTVEAREALTEAEEMLRRARDE